jgi:hypothetical protein
MPGLTGSASYYRNPRYYQRGHGLASILSGVWRFVKPLFFPSMRKLASGVMKSRTLRGVGRSVKKRAIKAGLNAVTNAVSGGDVKGGLKRDAESARDDLGESAAGLVGKIAREVGGGGRGKRKGQVPKKKKKAKKRRGTTIFDQL